ncbi:MAG TPA: cytochrome c [Candidatus Competibacter sp.]|nr:cytochrome c family protein [Candidatus Competibacteraceae bacterium]HRC71060.1 cytochrome c [Candidatus Competibacter sp.]
MTRFALRSFVALVVCGALAGTAQAAGDPAAGKAKFETCTGCHAIPGYTNAYPTYHVPRLGGQHPDYVVAALKGYQAGERQHPTMHANSSSLSEQDMQDIAAYLSSYPLAKEANPISGNVAAGKVKSVACVACHGPDGNGPIPLYPRLAGQYEDYLTKVLHDYKTGKRNNSVMKGMALPLTEQDIADLAAYFASQPKGLVVVGHN